MARLSRLAPALLVAGLAGCATPGGGEGWTSLFDGRGLEAFEKVGDANWRLEGGAVVADKGTGFLVTRADYGDFHIRAEFYAESDSNSGIFIRCNNRQKITAADCYEANIWDTRPAQEYATGGIVDVAKVSPVPRVGGKWNTMEVIARGDHLVVMVNGVKSAEARHGKHARGPIGLQRAPGNAKEAPTPIKFRKVEIRAL